MTVDDAYRAAFQRGYVECALWSSTDWPEDEHDEPTSNLDENYGPDDLSASLVAEVDEDCTAFIDGNRADLEQSGLSPDTAGGDFWLTRNGHGAGFWDRGLGTVGDRLSDAARVYGEENWYSYNGEVTQ